MDNFFDRSVGISRAHIIFVSDFLRLNSLPPCFQLRYNLCFSLALMKHHKQLWWLQSYMRTDTSGNPIMSLLIAITASCYQLATGMKTTVVDMNVCSLLAVFGYSLCCAFRVIIQRFLGKKRWSADIHASFL